MRITNKMMTNNVMNSINRNKNKVNDYENKYTTGKKIQKPSDDPIIAVRALKLRSNISELDQYKEKNIPDAMSWMEVSESALNNVNDLIKKMNDYCVQGANDTLSVSARASIVDNLTQLKSQIYQECNANYAGRYVFSGFKTNSSMTFENGSSDLEYSITETFGGTEIEKIEKVTGEYRLDDFKQDSTREDFKESPILNQNVYRIKLNYDNLDDKDVKITTPNGEMAVKYMKSTDLEAYVAADDEVIVLRDTGELIMNNNTYAGLRDYKADEIVVDYQKTIFKTGDVKPEHYFNCSSVDKYGDKKIYEKADQDIFYEVNFSQSMKVNTQLSNYLGNEVAREIDELVSVVQDVENAQAKMTEVDKMLEDPNLTEKQKQALESMKEQLSTEFVLKSKIMTDHFEKGIENTDNYETSINIALADLGSRYQRLELTQSRLGYQADDFTDLLSTNEDVDLVETYVKLTSAESIYTASLSAASKIGKNSLLDFI